MTKKTNKSKSNLARDKVIKEMADLVSEAIKKGEKPWLRPWDTSKCTSGLAHNVVSKKPYRGVNQFYLGLCSIDFEFASFKQWSEVGRKHAIKNGEFEMATDKDGKSYKKTTTYYGVQKGAKAVTVVYFTMLKLEDKDNPDETTMIPLLKWHKVFGRSDTNIPAPIVEKPTEDEMPTFTETQERIEGEMHDWMESEGIGFAEGGERAFYRYSTDHIQMPDKVAFPSGYAYMPTLFHESVHSTGHRKRLNRKMGMGMGSNEYAFEELVAEMGASLLCRHHNILPTDALEDGLENQVSYIAHWLKQLKSNPKTIIQAGSKAQRAVDYILGTTFEDNKNDEKKGDIKDE